MIKLWSAELIYPQTIPSKDDVNSQWGYVTEVRKKDDCTLEVMHGEHVLETLFLTEIDTEWIRTQVSTNTIVELFESRPDKRLMWAFPNVTNWVEINSAILLYAGNVVQSVITERIKCG